MAGYQSIYAGKSANPALGGKSNPFAADFKPGQYYVKQQPKSDAKQQQQQQQPAQQQQTKPQKSLFDKIITGVKGAGSAAAGTALAATRVGTGAIESVQDIPGQAVHASTWVARKVTGKDSLGTDLNRASDRATEKVTAPIRAVSRKLDEASLAFGDVGAKVYRPAQIAGNVATIVPGLAAGGASLLTKFNKAPKVAARLADAAFEGTTPTIDKVVGKLAGTDKKAAAKDLVTNAKTAQLIKTGKNENKLDTIANPKPALDPTTDKALNTVMAGVHQSKDDIAAQTSAQAASKAAEAETAQTAKATEKATADTKKIDQQLEVYDAKAKDAKAKGTTLSNVDQVKIKQLKDQKAELVPTATPAPDKVPTIKAFGKDIQLTRENGYTPVETPNGTIYQKAQRKGTNAQGSSFQNAWYDSTGNKISDTQAQALKNTKPAPTVAPETPATPTVQSPAAEVTPPPVSPTVEKPAESAALSKSSTGEKIAATGSAVAKEDGVSRVFARLKAEHPDELSGETKYTTINLKDQAKKATKLLEEDKQKAYRIATGQEDSPHLTSTSANIALAEKALDEGNTKLYADLIKQRSLAQTRRGQEIVSEKMSVTDNSTSRYVKELLATRLDKLGEKHTFGIDLKKVTSKEKATALIDKEVAKVTTQIKNRKLDVKTALALIDKMECL